MPSLPDIPGKGLITGMTKRTRTVVATAGAGALAVGGFVARRLLHHGGADDEGASADPIAETPTAPPGAEEKPVPKPKPAKPKAAPKPKPAKPKPAPKPKADKPAKPKADEPPKTTGTDAPPKPEAEPGDQTGGKDPHHALNNPVVDDPDLTEYPDPYETREDPLDEPHPQTGAESTSEPPLEQDPEVERGGRPPRRDNLDD
jgi:hypothetical protein